MPSTATITAFYSFTANTKARASQVNGNFDVFRGHLLPIDPNTQTAISNTYDLGSSDYRWRAVYLRADVGSITAAVGGIAIGTVMSASFLTGTSTPMANSTVTISTIGRPVEYSFIPTPPTASSAGFIGLNNVGAASVWIHFKLMRDGTEVATTYIAGTGGNGSDGYYYPPSSVKFIDFPSQGTYKYSVNVHMLNGSATSALFTWVKPFAKEL